MARRPDPTDLIAAAQRVLGHPSLRSGQLEALQATMSGRDVVAVMPTGHGKSALYQLPAALLDGVTVVVSPLIALQRDQVTALEEAPAGPPARALNSTQGAAETDEVWRVVEESGRMVLFLSPEQLARDEVVARLGEHRVAQVVVDEAHCISAWGHDFRPDYLRLGTVVDRLGHPPVLALTATAPRPVRDEVVERLHLRDPLVLVRGFDRPNLHLEVRRHVEEGDRRAAVVDTVAGLEMPGLLYVATRRDTTAYAALLAERGLRAVAYHGGLRAAERHRAHEQFDDGSADVVVATSAFGMGIDKPDIRFVVHAATPDTPEGYYQEIGRGGRDGARAAAVLFYRPEDFSLHRFHAGRGVDEELVGRLVRRLRREPDGLTHRALAAALEVSTRRVSGAVNLLERVEAVRVEGSTVRATDATPKVAVRRAVEEAEVRQRVGQSRMDMMRGYAETTGCRRRFLLGYLGEELDGPCGNCDTCEDGVAGAVVVDAGSADAGADPFPVGRAVRHRTWGDGIVMSAEPDRVTVLFEREGYRTLSLELVNDEELLSSA